MDMDWRDHWGNFLVTHRTPENWRKYGEEGGRLQAENEWDEFLFYRDASSLAVTPKAVDKKTDEMASEFASLRLYGIEMHEQYRDQTEATPAERKIWSTAFRQAYEKVIEGRVDDLIPSKLRKNLDLFCNMLSWMRVSMDHGDSQASDYGLELAGRKKKEPPKEPPKPTYKPTQKEIRDYIAMGARARVNSIWKRYMARKADGAEFRTDMITFEFRFPSDWDISEVDDTTGIYLYGKAFREEIGEKALELAPASAWKNAYLICSLYDLILIQEHAKKEVVPSGESRPRKGFWAKERHKSFTEQHERQEWEFKTRREIERGFERQAKRLEKQKPKMSGPGDPAGPQALVIVHLSSLDAYTDHAGSEEGKLLGERLTQAILSHPGPVIIVDQDWETGYRASRPRESLLEAIQHRQGIVWIKFDEAVESWDDFFPKLYAALDEQGATSAVIGGIWYEPSLHTGCATFVYLQLRQRMPAVVDEDLVGCE